MLSDPKTSSSVRNKNALLHMGLNFMLGILWSRVANKLNNRLFPPKRTLIVYEGEEALAGGHQS